MKNEVALNVGKGGCEVQVSLINEPVVIEEPKRESATARAMRRWFEQNPTVENEPAG